MKSIHTFHIPVMGTGFTIDSPIKVAHYGISSVISLVDDTVIEQMRQYYCRITNRDFTPINKYDEDFRAKRITAYLNLVDQIVKEKFEAVKNSCFEFGSEITKYFELLSDHSPLKSTYKTMLASTNTDKKKELQQYLRSQMKPGSIDVNIMTKLDRTNYAANKKDELPPEFSDALSALRGYAQSTLQSAIIFSAGINRRLYTYVEKFKDFYEDANGHIKKKIIIKVSDYRSALTQGRFFAKKGLWVSEYRIESGLNCGGHAFATEGLLMGPILDEFKRKKEQLITDIHKVYVQALKKIQKAFYQEAPDTQITAQGGIGTAHEQEFLLDHFQLDGTGWATPFLLVPEATNVDNGTLQKLSAATEKDLYLSGISPLGVPFNNLRQSDSDLEKMERVRKNHSGSACPKGHLVSNTEFTDKPICSASRQYQKLKIEQLDSLNISPAERQKAFNTIIEKACICHDLAASPIIQHGLQRKGEKLVTAICPGPNMAYFSTISTLKEMVDHIYGRLNLLNTNDRPHMFLKELKQYVDYFKKEIIKQQQLATQKQADYLTRFKENLIEGIAYYKKLFPQMLKETQAFRQHCLDQLENFRIKIEKLLNDQRGCVSANGIPAFKKSSSNHS